MSHVAIRQRPVLAYFEVADCSGMMSVVLWNSLCPRFFRSLEVGTVIFIVRYVVKEAFQMRTRPVSYYPDLKTYKEIDISLNPQKPAADIKIIPPKQVKPEWRLPSIKYRFITRDLLDTLPDTYVCDVIGLVTFVGRCERIRKKDDDNAFWVRRFVEMIDQTSTKPFILELYCTSQPDIYNQLHPVSFLVCTQMRVVRNNFHDGCSIAYLTSSSETQIYITGYHKGRPYTTDTTVRRFIQWAKSQHKTDFLERSVVGGYYSFPPLPSNFQAYSQNMKDISEMDEVPKSKSLNWSWESSKWSEIKSRVKEFLSFGHLLLESCPQKFEYAKKEAIMSQHNLQSSRCSSLLFDSSNCARDFATAWSNGYYALTIVDLNQEIALDVVFLPLTTDKIFITGANDTTFISILSGGWTSETSIINGNKTVYISN
ncbi:RPA-related protein RADX-like [Rhincodon typus]|uniref:RPA-related protein RADX-like n=1 Tax=Rhincodon typus TaxID=259920 RepID=UPI00202E9B28|nr:RPA-related protein RADX-like [Rhincodon typus]